METAELDLAGVVHQLQEENERLRLRILALRNDLSLFDLVDLSAVGDWFGEHAQLLIVLCIVVGTAVELARHLFGLFF